MIDNWDPPAHLFIYLYLLFLVSLCVCGQIALHLHTRERRSMSLSALGRERFLLRWSAWLALSSPASQFLSTLDSFPHYCYALFASHLLCLLLVVHKRLEPNQILLYYYTNNGDVALHYSDANLSIITDGWYKCRHQALSFPSLHHFIHFLCVRWRIDDEEVCGKLGSTGRFRHRIRPMPT